MIEPHVTETHRHGHGHDIDWSKVRSVDDCILPVGFSHADGHELVGAPWEWLGHVAHGSRVQDRVGNRFLIMGYGSVQGTVILRDRYRRMFHADIDQYLRVL